MSIVLPLPAQAGYKLSDYRFLVRRLLHDSNANYYPDGDINKYINLARQTVAKDSGCVRVLQTNVTLTQGTDTYDTYTFLPYGAVTIDVLGITVYYGSGGVSGTTNGNLRVAMRRFDWTYFNANYRSQLTYQQVPTIFSKYGNQIYVAPVPNQSYISDWDTVVLPNDLQDDTTPEQIPQPFQEPVAFYAAYYAKQYEQSLGEADRFMQQYIMQMRRALSAYDRRIAKNPYAPPT